MASNLYAGFSSDSFLSLHQVKARTGLSRIKIAALIQAGTLQKFSRQSGEVAFSGNEVDAWTDAQISLAQSQVQRLAYTQLVVKAVDCREDGAKFCGVSLHLKRSILNPTGKMETLNRLEVSGLLSQLLSTVDSWVYGNGGDERKIRPLCFPILNQGSSGQWGINFLFEIPSVMETRDFIKLVMTLWRKGVWSTDTWSAKLLDGRDQVQKWFEGSLSKISIDENTVDHSNVYIPRNALYALSPPTVVDPCY